VVAQGARMGHILGYRRGREVLVLVPRFHHTLAGNWADTRIPLPEGEWKNWFTGASLQGSVTPVEVFRDFPVAALVLSP
jgi:(1->4)-alpha-D-glucan 1-alpha-D-glucosylmutase